MKGILLACLGVLILTPDALLIRLSELSAAPLVAWRGLAMGTFFLVAALLIGQARHLPRLASGVGVALILAQWANAALFAPAISLAPVALVLIAVATVPICAALWSWLLYQQPTRPVTWVTIAIVTCGIAFAMSGKGEVALSGNWVLGVLCGIGVALSLSLSFTLLRHNPEMPLLLAVGIGALLSGSSAFLFTSPAEMASGTTWAIALASFVVLPLSFYLMSEASRHTASVNVSLVLLLETILGPLWVWAGIGEAPTARMVIGGAIVIATLAVYLWHLRRSV
ncbi:DMT family transporter [Marivita hallyeonensis]|uniref:EamA-like transporter family protein n=1 Tax=Marivita hallyeonensis TaxID=996342 RepID=A0A1M5VUC7_9RHOB|nr:DMT family transporter [Marivita hallyeonensis]SHH78872.1 EamA-like transporter family protein [Marivita hallyeonensis]